MDKIEEFIADYLSGNISEENRKLLLTWVAEKEENRKYFDDRREIWFSSMSSDEIRTFSPSRGFLKFTKLRSFSGKRKSAIPPRARWATVSVACCISAALLFFAHSFFDKAERSTVSDIVVQVPSGSRTAVTLPDGSLVRLNSLSKITYNSDFGTSNRQVSLSGEAHFDVIHDDGLPFTVHAGKMTITDLGTVFNISNYDDDPTVSLVLVEGKLSYSFEDSGTSEEMAPGEKLVYDKAERKTAVSSVNTDVAVSWIKGRYIFENETLASIARKLERGFGVKISIADPSIAAIRFFGSFDENTRDVDEVLHTLSGTGRISYSSEGKSYTIRKQT